MDPEVAADTTAAEVATSAESLVEQFDRISKAEGATDAQEAPEAPKGLKTKADPKTSQDANAELQALKDLAAKHGYAFEGGAVTVAERAAFREAKRKAKESIAAERASFEKEAHETWTSRKSEIEEAAALKTAREKGDYQQIAKILGHKDWTALQDHMLAQTVDPNYKRLQELEQKISEQGQREEEARQKAETEAQTRRRHEETIKYQNALTAQMKESKDPFIAGMHDDPLFVQTIMRIQQENWDDETQSTVTPEQAAKMAVRGVPKALRQEMEELYERLHKALGRAAVSDNKKAKPIVKATLKTEEEAPRAKTQNGRPDANEPAWFKYAEAAMKESLDS